MQTAFFSVYALNYMFDKWLLLQIIVIVVMVIVVP